MIRSSTVRVAALAVVLSGGAIAVSCSKSGPNAGSGAGKVSLAFTLPSGAQINDVSYDIHAGAPSGIPDVTGHIGTSTANATIAHSFPASIGDTVTLDATTTTGVSCHGVSMPFNVNPGGVAQVSVTLICGAATNPAGPSSVIVNSVVVEGNSCPFFTSWVASPLQTSVGGAINVGAVAADLTMPPDTLTYAWSPAATFVSPTSATTLYFCTTPGTHSISVTVNDNHGTSPCAATVDVIVTCIGPSECGNGTVELGEQCDPPNGTTCDNNCQTIGSATGGTVGTGGAAGAPGTGGSTGTRACANCEISATADGTCFNTSVDGTTNGCDGFTGAARDACYALLTCIRTGNGSGHTCGNLDDSTPCLCGTLTASACSQLDPTTLPGVCKDQYIAANGGTGAGLYGVFFSNTSPVGIPNNLFTCDIDMATDTSLSCPSSLCGVLSATGGTGGAAGAQATGGTIGSGGMGGATGGTIGSGGQGGMAGQGGTGGQPTDCASCEIAALADGTCFNTSVDGTTNGCDGFTGTARDACNALLTCIRTGNGSGHTCGNADDPTPCLCGTLTANACGQLDPTTLSGVCKDQYIAANGGTGAGLYGVFFSNTSPVGIANSLFTCDIDMATDTSLSCPSSICGVQ